MKKTPPPPAKPPRLRRRRLRSNFYIWPLAWTLIGIMTVGVLAYTFYSMRAALININVIKRMPEASILYDFQGKPFSRFFEENRIELPAAEPVPKLLGEAVVATEDK